MKVGVCDFPSTYAFPPHGYGGIERWLWAVAVGAQRAGAEVRLLGPAWRDDLPRSFPREPIRLETVDPGDAALRRLEALNLDLLVVGHEYPSLPAWRRVWEELDCDVVTFQHNPTFIHAAHAFDRHRSRLYCYSPEMIHRYREHHPSQTLSVQFGLGEEPLPVRQGHDLVWIGRIDRDKAPHLAARAAGLLGRRLRVIGPVLDRWYLNRHWADLGAAHVELVGELVGRAKAEALRDGRVVVYTCARDYIEAGAAVFGEALRAGTPMAALAWRAGTCAEAALCGETGAVATVSPEAGDGDAVARLAGAIENAATLAAESVQHIGLARFDPERHFRILACDTC